MARASSCSALALAACTVAVALASCRRGDSPAARQAPEESLEHRARYGPWCQRLAHLSAVHREPPVDEDRTWLDRQRREAITALRDVAPDGRERSSALPGADLALEWLREVIVSGHAEGCYDPGCEAIAFDARLTNRGAAPLEVRLSYEWHGGIPPASDMSGRSRYPDGRQAHTAILLMRPEPSDDAEAPPRHALREIAPGASLEVRLRLDWRGTGSRPEHALIDHCQGRYALGASMLYRRTGTWFHAEFPPLSVSVR